MTLWRFLVKRHGMIPIGVCESRACRALRPSAAGTANSAGKRAQFGATPRVGAASMDAMPALSSIARRRPTAALLAAATAFALCGCAVPPSTPSTPSTDAPPLAGASSPAPLLPRWDALADDVAQRIAGKVRAWPADAPALHVVSTGASPFHLALRSLLVSRLRERGVAVAVEPTGVDLRLETQLVGGRVPQLMVTASLENDGRYLARVAGLYSVPAADVPLYLAQAAEPAVVLRVVNP